MARSPSLPDRHRRVGGIPPVITVATLLVCMLNAAARAQPAGTQPASQPSPPVGGPVLAVDSLQPVEAAADELRQQTAPAGLELSLGVTGVVQLASDSVDESSPGLFTASYDFAGRWNLVDRPGATEGRVGWLVEGGRPIGAGRFADLSQRVGSDFGINDDLDSEPAAVTELWWQQRGRDDRWRLTIGKLDQTVYFDANRFADDETRKLVATPLVNNPAIAFPDNSLGANARFELADGLELRAGVGDAWARATRTGFDSVGHGDLFTAAQLGITPVPNQSDSGKYRLLAWRSELSGVNDRGLAISWNQPITESLAGFGRYGWAEGEITGFEQAATLGLAWPQPFNRSTDLFAVAGVWGEPNDPVRREEKLFEMFYRVRVTETLEVTPDVQLIVDPASNPGRDAIIVGGLRLQLLF